MQNDIVPGPTHYQAKFHGSGEVFAGVVLKNFFLTIITLGIYAPWAKTNRRKYLWQNTEFSGQRLTYTGTGREITIGYAKVFIAYIAFGIVSSVLGKMPTPIPIIAQIATPLIILPVIGYAIYASRAFLLRVTYFRGLQFGLAKTGRGPYTKTFFLWSILSLITLGILRPIMANKLHTIMTNNTRFGTEPLRYTGSDHDAFRIFINSLPWLVLTLGIYYFWYHAKVLHFRAEHTTFADARANFKVSGNELFNLTAVNIFLLLITLGLAFPWVVCRNVAFAVDRLSFTGNIDFDRIASLASRGDAIGDAAADILDVDLGI